MPAFKHKNVKKIVVSKKNITTLDGKHKEIIDGFTTDKEEQMPLLLNEKREICMKLKNVNLTVDERLDLYDTLTEIKKKIGAIKKKEKEYLLNNSSYVFDYFENKKKIADCANKTTLLDKFFKINTEDHELMDELGKERKNIQTYMTNVDESFLDINNFVIQTETCSFCNKGEMIAVDYEGILICNFCSTSVKYLVENEKPSYKEPPKEVCFMRTNASIISAKSWRNFKPKKPRKFPTK